MTDPELDAAVAEIQVTGCDSKIYKYFFLVAAIGLFWRMAHRRKPNLRIRT